MAEEQFADVFRDIGKAAGVLGLPGDKVERLRHPRREVSVAVPVIMDDGGLRVFKGFRVQYYNSRGPFKGGVRYDPGVDLPALRALAVITGLRNAVMELPWGGAMGGVACDPSRLSAGELERLTRRYTYMLLPFIGPVKDISEPSRGTDGRVMSWMMDTYSMLVGHTVPGVVTGKPLSLGGTRGSADATGRGVMFVVRRALADSGVAIDGAKAAVVGFGSVGRAAALHLARKGCRVVAAADLGGGVHRPDGLDVGALSSWAGERGSVAGFPGAGAVSDEELMALGVDALVVASREMAVTAQNQRLVAAPLVAEAVDASVSSEACDALHERGAVVLPDLLAGAGGDTLSYFEWVQNASSILWSEREVNVRLRDLMLKAYDEVSAVARERGVDMRTAAYVLGVGRLVDAQSWRGVWP